VWFLQSALLTWNIVTSKILRYRSQMEKYKWMILTSIAAEKQKPLIGNLYQYHLFLMLFIFILISFAALSDDMTFKLFGKRKRKKGFFLGCANLIAATTVEEFCMVCTSISFAITRQSQRRNINAIF
jgi:hypothetical protein